MVFDEELCPQCTHGKIWHQAELVNLCEDSCPYPHPTKLQFINCNSGYRYNTDEACECAHYLDEREQSMLELCPQCGHHIEYHYESMTNLCEDSCPYPHLVVYIFRNCYKHFVGVYKDECDCEYYLDAQE